MKKYEVTVTAPTIGKGKHVIRQRTKQDAIDRAKAAHPKGTVIEAKEVKK